MSEFGHFMPHQTPPDPFATTDPTWDDDAGDPFLEPTPPAWEVEE